ncbi:MAG TPA: hypothetical protein VGQ20_16000 [Acidimicrobiales bacterium]|nr:hypothetical protein [Acidimicrobiales bacterium]
MARASDDDALDWLHETHRTDGLPVVVPTESRVERILTGTRLAPAQSLGRVGPALGDATVEKVAINAVMAGCEPRHLPVVIATVRAVCDPVMDMTEVQATTHNLGPMIIVNGPVRYTAGVACGFGALGHGHRANLSIGRALRLCLINIGGGWPGESDMALLGHPGKVSYCLGEDEESSPITPLHTTRGFDATQSAVTVVCVEAPHSVLAFLEADDPTMPDRILDSVAGGLSNIGANNSHSGHGTVAVVLNPDHAGAIAAGGHTRASIAQALFERAGVCVRDMRRVVPPARAHIYAGRADDERLPALGSPDDIMLVVAGGTGLYSAVMPSWGAGPHSNQPVTVEVEQ